MAQAVLPQLLKDAGWKLERKIVNDDEDHPLFQVRHERLKLATNPTKVLDEAIEGALVLQTRSEGRKVNRAKIKSQVSSLKSQAAGAVAGEEIAGPAQLLEIKKIRRDGGTQPREGLDLATVEKYAEAKKAGAVFEPSVVFYDGKDYWLGRGFHRTAADEKNGHKRTYCEIRQGTQRDAILFSLGENHDHGLPRTNEQKRNAVMTMLRDNEWSTWSDGVIAEKAKASDTFVGKLRKEFIREQGPTPNVSSSTVRRGKDNRVRETKKIGRQKSELPASAGGAPAGDITVTDRRRFAGEEVRDSEQSLIAGETPAVPVKAVSLEKLLNGRMLSISFGCIPKVPGVNVTVNASTDREKATRKLIGWAEMPAMPEVVIEMIAAALGETSPKSTTKRPSAAQAALNKHKARKAVLKKKRGRRRSRRRSGEDMSKRPKADCSECGLRVATYEDIDGFDYFSTHDWTPGQRCSGSGKRVYSHNHPEKGLRNEVSNLQS
jgi:hypothetical protein